MVEVSQEGNMLKLVFFRPPVGSAEILGGAIHYADISTLVTFRILQQPFYPAVIIQRLQKLINFLAAKADVQAGIPSLQARASFMAQHVGLFAS